jgi:propanol-preferring alcohol dehydrogenase
MNAMVLTHPGRSLEARTLPIPAPDAGQVLVAVSACAVCRTDLHVVDGELPDPKLPLIPGHEVVGRVSAVGSGCSKLSIGDRVGIPWLGWTCGACSFCAEGLENLCLQARFTGYTLDGGYAEFCVADERFCFPIPEAYTDASAAPLLCAGLIGYRSLMRAGNARVLGIYGFGAAAHIVAQVAVHQGRTVFAFTRPGDIKAQEFARSLGVQWAGDSRARPPAELDAAILFAPVGALVPAALEATRKGGMVVCGGIHMSDIPSFPYRLLWGERQLVSIANLTRKDATEFLALAARTPIKTHVQIFPLAQANAALEALRSGTLEGAAVLDTGA